jgi:D-xylose transport system substrate-binding protein
MQKRRRLLAAPAALLAAGLFLAACGSSDDSSSSSATSGDSSSAKGGKVALLLPETKTARYESQDKPLFEQKLKSLCSDCELLYSNANQVAATQLSQAESAITNGAKVIVLDPVDADAAGAIVSKANAANIPVISYDRLISNADIKYYISFDNEQVGKLQAQSLLQKLSTDGKPQIVMINGSATDPNAASFKKGAHSVLDGKVTIGKEYDTPEWSPDNAQNEMQQAITALGKDKIAGVYAANDGTASGAIAALKGAQISPLPPVTGQDAELAGIQRIVAGDQYMTIYKAIKPEAEQAAQLAAALAQGKTPSLQTTKVNNGKKDVDSVILTPVAVTKDNIKTTVVADGFWTVAQICTDQYKSACTAAGLS